MIQGSVIKPPKQYKLTLPVIGRPLVSISSPWSSISNCNGKQFNFKAIIMNIINLVTFEDHLPTILFIPTNTSSLQGIAPPLEVPPRWCSSLRVYCPRPPCRVLRLSAKPPARPDHHSPSFKSTLYQLELDLERNKSTSTTRCHR